MQIDRRRFLALSSGALAVSPFARAFAQAPAGAPQAPPPVTPVFTDVRRNVAIFTARGGTIGYLVNKDAVLAVDTQYADTAKIFLEGLKQQAGRGLDVLTFNFLYTEQRRRAPDRTEALDACYRAAVGAARRHFARDRVFIGGKSMGGRIASQVAAQGVEGVESLSGLVFLGYPLHPPGKPEQRRDAHLPAIAQPMLFVQGSKDAFGTAAELEA